MSTLSIAHTSQNNNISVTQMECLLFELDRSEQIALYWENITDENCNDCGRYSPYCKDFTSFPSKEWEFTLSKERVTQTSIYKSVEDSMGYHNSDDTIPWR